VRALLTGSGFRLSTISCRNFPHFVRARFAELRQQLFELGLVRHAPDGLPFQSAQHIAITSIRVDQKRFLSLRGMHSPSYSMWILTGPVFLSSTKSARCLTATARALDFRAPLRRFFPAGSGFLAIDELVGDLTA